MWCVWGQVGIQPQIWRRGAKLKQEGYMVPSSSKLQLGGRITALAWGEHMWDENGGLFGVG